LWKKDFSIQGDKPAAKAPEPPKPAAKASEPPKPAAKAPEPPKAEIKALEPADQDLPKPIVVVPEPEPKAAKPPVVQLPENGGIEEPLIPSAAEPPAAQTPLPEAPSPEAEAPKPAPAASPAFIVPRGSGPTYQHKFRTYGETAAAQAAPVEPAKSRTALDLEEIFCQNAEMAPFEKQSKDVKWVRVSIREPVALPIDYHRIFKDPFIISSYEKYNHFILGHVQDPEVRMYILGVPCIYSQQNLKTAKSLGFTQFKCVDNVLPANGEYGYCLLCVPLEE
jgi:hypothetical protein